MSKPYDNQMRIPSDELEEVYQNNEHNSTPLKMLIGNSESRKDYWIARNLKKDDVIIFPFNVPWYAKWKKSRVLFKKIKRAKKNNYCVIWSAASLTKKDRLRILKYLPEYRKCAIVWEQNLDDMLKSGYERPSSEEGFDDFTYIVS
jgi:hypothetical protein